MHTARTNDAKACVWRVAVYHYGQNDITCTPTCGEATSQEAHTYIYMYIRQNGFDILFQTYINIGNLGNTNPLNLLAVRIIMTNSRDISMTLKAVEVD